MAARLKVFTWSDGFHAHTVAASSRPKALAAWGVRQDLFASGLAREISEGPDVARALKTPGAVIERAEQAALKTMAAAKPAKRAGPTPAQQRKIGKLQEDLAALETARERDLKAIDQRIADLRAERDSVVAAADAREAALRDRLAAARAGGERRRGGGSDNPQRRSRRGTT